MLCKQLIYLAILFSMIQLLFCFTSSQEQCDNRTMNIGSPEERLYMKMLCRPLRVRPTPPESANTTAVLVMIQYNVIQILAFSQSEEILSIAGWFTITWLDKRLRWKPKEWGNVTDIFLPGVKLWLPDVGVMNGKSSKDFDFSANMNSKVGVDSHGKVTWLHGAILDVTCPLDVSFFPFDTQVCYMAVTPWMSSVHQMLLRPVQLGSTVDNSYLPNSNVSEWEIKMVKFGLETYNSQTNVTYQYIRISIQLVRQPLYFVVLVLVPFSMLSGLACLIFTLEDTGDRLSVALSLVLSMTMYVVIVSSNAPRSMRTLPVLGIYLLNQLGLLSVATVLAVVNQKLKEFKVTLPMENGTGSCSGVGFRHAYEEDDDSPIVELRRFPGVVSSTTMTTTATTGACNMGSCPTATHLNNSYKPSGRHRWQRCSGSSRRYPVVSKRFIYRHLGRTLDKAELLIYLLLSGVNAIICLFVLPATGKVPTPVDNSDKSPT